MALTTRQLTPPDWPDFWPMLKDMGTDHDESVARERYDRLIHDQYWGIIGAVDGTRLVGYAAVQDYGTHLRLGDDHRIARLHDLYVAPGERLRGVGTTLLDAARTWAAARTRYLEWQAGARTSAPFYERLGYRGEPCPQPEYPTFDIDFRAGT